MISPFYISTTHSSSFSDFHLSSCSGMAGGYSPSMLDAIRYAVQTSNIVQMLNKNGFVPLTFKEAFRLATLGGARGQYCVLADQSRDFFSHDFLY